MTCISDILKGKDEHIRKNLCRKRVNKEKKTALRGNASLKIDQAGAPKDICKTLIKPIIVNGLNYNLAEKLMQEEKVNYIQKGERKMYLKFHKPVNNTGDTLHLHLMKRDWVVMNRQPTLH